VLSYNPYLACLPTLYRDVPEGVYLARSLQEALALVTSPELAEKVEDVHVIGGSSVYKV